jgi:hypothetical protein
MNLSAKYRLFYDAFINAQSSKDLNKYLMCSKIENLNEYKNIKDINFKIFLKILFEHGLFKDHDQLFHANNIYNYFKQLHSIRDNTFNKQTIKMIKYTIVMFFR